MLAADSQAFHYQTLTLSFSYHDKDPIIPLCVRAQNYYLQHGYPIKLKACSTLSVHEIIQLAGVAAITVMPDQLAELAALEMPESTLAGKSAVSEGAVVAEERKSFVDDEEAFRAASSRDGAGLGQMRTVQVF